MCVCVRRTKANNVYSNSLMPDKNARWPFVKSPDHLLLIYTVQWKLQILYAHSDNGVWIGLKDGNVRNVHAHCLAYLCLVFVYQHSHVISNKVGLALGGQTRY